MMHPETKHGGDRKAIKSTICALENPKSFVNSSADKLGVNRMTIQRAVARDKKADVAVKKAWRDGKIGLTR